MPPSILLGGIVVEKHSLSTFQEYEHMSRTTIPMTENLNDYLVSVTPPLNPIAAKLRDRTAQLSNGSMQISIEQGNFMQVLLKVIAAK